MADKTPKTKGRDFPLAPTPNSDTNWKQDSTKVARMGDMNIMYTNRGANEEKKLMEKYPEKSFRKNITNKEALKKYNK